MASWAEEIPPSPMTGILPHHAQGNRLDGGTAKSAGADTQLGATALGVDGHTHEGIDERHAVGAFCLTGTGYLGNIGHIGR